MELQTISVEKLNDLVKNGTEIDLIDVRTPMEFREVHAKFARNAPLDILDPKKVMGKRNGLTGNPLYLICRSGSRAKKAYEKFMKYGYADVIQVDGGTVAWEQAGLPVNRGKKTISLERQVRIVAGLLVLFGAVLGLLMHPSLVGLSAFVGVGLVFAGITDTCGMGILLSKMPWNRVQKGSAECYVS